ncbi:MAG TPA: SAM-dependent methyltransferase, partial [Acetobacteraceae bacterium]|nr:SAM-dependent methyltransferase [Acetobacteraceae bacterium]
MSGTLLGGRVHHTQLAEGHRTGIEPVLLAASIPAMHGARVLEGGTGSGAGLLCLAARVQGIAGVGIERDPALAALARANIAANGFAGLAVLEGDLTKL